MYYSNPTHELQSWTILGFVSKVFKFLQQNERFSSNRIYEVIRYVRSLRLFDKYQELRCPRRSSASHSNALVGSSPSFLDNMITVDS